MNVLRRIVLGIAAVVVVALALELVAPKAVRAVSNLFITVTNTSANPVPVLEDRESRANFITLSFNVASGGYDEVLPDGSKSAFVIPTGQQFVITDVNWMATCASLFGGPICNKSAGDATALMLGSTDGMTAPYMSRAIYAGGTGFLNAGASDSFKSGLVVKQLPAPSILAQTNGEEILVVNLRGYLVP